MATQTASAITLFLPIAAFLIVFVTSYLIFAKTKLLSEQTFLNLLISFIIASIFVSAGGAVRYITTVTPLFAILMVSLVFIMLMTGFIGKGDDKFYKNLGLAFTVILGLIFLFAAFGLFSTLIEDTFLVAISYPPRIMGALLLILISSGVAWVLIKAK